MTFKPTIKEIQDLYREFKIKELEENIEVAKKRISQGRKDWNRFYSCEEIIDVLLKDIDNAKKGGENVGYALHGDHPTRDDLYVAYLLTDRRDQGLVLTAISSRLGGTTYGHAKNMKSDWEEGSKRFIKETGYTRYHIRDGKFVGEEKVPAKEVGNAIEAVIDDKTVVLEKLQREENR